MKTRMVASVAAALLLLTVIPAGSASAITAPSGYAVAQRIARHVPDIEKLQKLTKVTDGNNLLGKANGYTSATVIYDDRAVCDDDGPGAACGGVVETFATAAKAQKRANYLVRVFRAFSGTEVSPYGEHDRAIGKVVLRVNGMIDADGWSAYLRAFTKAVK